MQPFAHLVSEKQLSLMNNNKVDNRGIEEEQQAIHIMPSQSLTGTTIPMHKQSKGIENHSRDNSVSRIQHTQQSQQPGEALADRVMPSLGDKDSDLEVEGSGNHEDLEFQDEQVVETIYAQAQSEHSSEEQVATYRDETQLREVGAIETSGPNIDMG